jgi:DNA-binding NarL/FixJ family response regulator
MKNIKKSQKIAVGEPQKAMIFGKKKDQWLTPRQYQVMVGVVQGKSNREIGQELKCSVRTIEIHRFDMMHKLCVKNIPQLIRKALEEKLITVKEFLGDKKKEKRLRLVPEREEGVA